MTSRSCLFYLGPSPRHASSVSLVLSLTTGCVSPQFHLQYDDFFETVRPSAGNLPTHSVWCDLAGFRSHKPLSQPTEGANTPSEGASNDEEPTIPQSESLQPTAPSEDAENTDTDTADSIANDPDNVSMPPTPTSTSRYGRQRRQTARMRESQQQREQGHVAYQAFNSTYYEVLHEDDYRLQDDMEERR